ncbi:MAG: carboxymuconolactone decarboxylase family protein [Rhodospirillaceae bacterium]|nr:carboxymuconolactone decarboxylase family protein [Rhodospirillaceae bacterium]MCA8934042.1 carboxymuconolactone decarboxylase family protein [Rhodospirillaceae bacterium]
MSIDALKQALPDYAKDIRLNLSSLATDPSLGAPQRAGCFIATALAVGNAVATRELVDAFAGDLSPEQLTAAKGAAAIMAMNNVYYRTTHMLANTEYKQFQSKLRMNILASHGIDKTDFELWSLAVSAVNACGMCLDAHERKVRAAGLTAEQVQTAIRIAAVVHAVGAVLDGEAALADTPAAAAAA